MKYLLMLAVATFAFATAGQSQAKKGIQTVTVSTPTVQCEQCKNRIERYLVREDGIQKVNVDYKHKKTKVTFYSERTNIENIKAAIANVGYDADDIAANPEAYEKLPDCCQKPKQ